MKPPVTYTCLCCGHTETFAAPTAAYEAGWDIAPFFTLQPLCSLCPAAPLAMKGIEAGRMRHAPVHSRWGWEGRPREFDVHQEILLDINEHILAEGKPS